MLIAHINNTANPSPPTTTYSLYPSLPRPAQHPYPPTWLFPLLQRQPSPPQYLSVRHSYRCFSLLIPINSTSHHCTYDVSLSLLHLSSSSLHSSPTALPHLSFTTPQVLFLTISSTALSVLTTLARISVRDSFGKNLPE